jgi:DNA-directed RNA polymerase specialized sigma24 family protein
MISEQSDRAKAPQESDLALHRFLDARDEQLADAALEEVIGRAQPVIDGILGYYRRRNLLDAADCEDISSTIRLRLLVKLRRLRDGDAEPIANYSGYVARLAFNAVKDVFRGRGPERALLKKRIREIATNDPRFVLQPTGDGVACRLRSQSGRPRMVPPEFRAMRGELGEALEALLRDAGGPLLMNDVVTALSADAVSSPPPGQAHPPSPLVELERRQEMALLWSEIMLLPPGQRAALLLNLRAESGSNVLALLIVTGVATFDAVAAALEMTPQGLGAIMHELPWDDLTIAKHLGVTRQQVINLRKSARKRLERRSGRGAPQ